MPVVNVDLNQFSGVEPGLEPDEGSVWFWPYRPYIEDSTLISREVLKVRTEDGIAAPVLPETPSTEAVWVQLRGVKGAGTPWLVQIPATDVNLFDLPHTDPDTLDPEAPPSPAWLAALAAAEADIATAQSTADGAASDATDALAGLAGKVDQATYDTAIGILTAAADSKADDAATTAALATKVNSSTYTAGLALKADVTALNTETAARIKGDAAPLVTKRTLGDINLVNTTGSYVDLDDSGTPNARNLDIVFPDVVAGQVVELEPNLLASNGAGFAFLTFGSIVNGAVVNQIHGAVAGGVAGWFLPASAFGTASGAFPYTLQAGDIENGNARFRLRYRSNGSKTIYANGVTTYALAVIGSGPKG